jgi:hypothetical protein
VSWHASVVCMGQHVDHDRDPWDTRELREDF